MKADTTKILLTAFGIFGLVFVFALIASNSTREVVGIEIAIQWAVRLIGLTVTMVGVLELFRVAAADREGSSGRLAWCVVVAMVGLMLAFPHWTVALSITAIVVALVIMEGIRRDRSGDQP